MAASIVRVMTGSSGVVTPHDGRYVVDWNPHVEYGTLEVTSTDDINKARRFEGADALKEWRTISKVQVVRPDGRPNRPLTGLSVQILNAPE